MTVRADIMVDLIAALELGRVIDSEGTCEVQDWRSGIFCSPATFVSCALAEMAAVQLKAANVRSRNRALFFIFIPVRAGRGNAYDG
jgi:hypothetical protein